MSAPAIGAIEIEALLTVLCALAMVVLATTLFRDNWRRDASRASAPGTRPPESANPAPFR